MMRYIKISLLLLLLLGSVVSSAQVEAGDTGRAVIALVSGDSTNIRRLHADIRTQTASGDKAGLAESYYNVSVIYYNRSIRSQALKYFLAATKLAEETGNKERIGWCYMWLGSFYKGDSTQKALDFLSQSNKIFMQLGNKHGLGSVYNARGDVYERAGDYAKAHSNYFAAVNMLREGDQEQLVWPYFNIGEIYALQGSLDSAKLYYDSALALQIATHNKSGEAWTYNNIAYLFIKKQDYAQAEKYCLAGLHIVDSLGEAGGKLNVYKHLIIIYEGLGNDKNVIKYYKLHNALLSTVNNEESAKKIVQQQMQYDFDKEKELQKIEQERKDQFTTISVVILVLLVLIAVLAFYFQKRSSDLKAALLSQKEQALSQKEMLMKEIHHRVKNNLQITGTLLNLQLEKIEDNNAKEAITESIARVNTISLIHNQLYTNEQTSTLDFSHFATELHKQLKALYIRKGQEVTWYNQMSNLILDIDTAIPLGLIINELITNSYKHAFKKGTGMIRLTIEQNGGNYTFSYTDDGPGLPLGIDISHSKGLGMMIVHSLSKQIGGSFKYIRDNNTFIVSFKDAAEMKKTE